MRIVEADGLPHEIVIVLDDALKFGLRPISAACGWVALRTMEVSQAARRSRRKTGA